MEGPSSSFGGEDDDARASKRARPEAAAPSSAARAAARPAAATTAPPPHPHPSASAEQTKAAWRRHHRQQHWLNNQLEQCRQVLWPSGKGQSDEEAAAPALAPAPSLPPPELWFQRQDAHLAQLYTRMQEQQDAGVQLLVLEEEQEEQGPPTTTTPPPPPSAQQRFRARHEELLRLQQWLDVQKAQDQPFQLARSSEALTIVLNWQRIAGERELRAEEEAAARLRAAGRDDESVDAPGPWDPSSKLRARGPRPRVQDFLDTSRAAARVCREWRGVAFRTARFATIGRGPTGQSEDARPYNALAALRPYAGGGALLRPRLEGQPTGIEDLVRAAGLYLTGDAAEVDAGVATLLQGLTSLAFGSNECLATQKLLMAAAPHVRRPPPLLFSSLTRLRFVWYGEGAAGQGAFSLFSRRNFPVLSEMDVTVAATSSVPLVLAWGGGPNADDAARPPPLKQLFLKAPPGPQPHSAAWRPDQPLLVYLPSLWALGQTLEALCVDAPKSDGLASAAQHHALVTGNAPPPGHLAPLARLLPGMAQLNRLTALRFSSPYDFAPAGVHHQNSPPQNVPGGIWAPWGLPPSMPPPWQWEHEERPALERARRREYRLAARQLFSGWTSLRRLDLIAPREERGGAFPLPSSPALHLPPALSLLSALTSLDICAPRLIGTGSGLRGLRALRRLTVHEWSTFKWRREQQHAPVAGDDLARLDQLRFLALSQAPHCVAPVVRNALPRLETLVLRLGQSHWRGENSDDGSDLEEDNVEEEPEPPLAVLEAARARQRRGVVVRLEKCFLEGAPRVCRPDELEYQIYWHACHPYSVGDGEERHDKEHAEHAAVVAAEEAEDEEA
jgi:hypothetical protein